MAEPRAFTWRHTLRRPARHWGHSPQATTRSTTTWSPTLTFLTSLPTSTMTLKHSHGRERGGTRRWGSRPGTDARRSRTRLAAFIWISTSLSAGLGTGTSRTSNCFGPMMTTSFMVSFISCDHPSQLGPGGLSSTASLWESAAGPVSVSLALFYNTCILEHKVGNQQRFTFFLCKS